MLLLLLCLLRLLHLDAFEVPIFLRVVNDAPVAAELAHLNRIQLVIFIGLSHRSKADLGGGPDALLDPLIAILVRLVNHAQSLDI